MPFDLEAARKAGATDQQILEFLAGEQNFDLQEARKAGATDDQIIDFLASEISPESPEPRRPVTGGILPSLRLPEPERPIPVSFALPTVSKETAQPVLESIGSTVGSAVGAATGGPVGGVIGGTLGFAAARELSDIIAGEQNETLGEELVEAGENILEGAKLEALGLIGSKILTPIGRKLFRTAKTAKLAARQIKRLMAAKKLGVPVTIGEAVDSQALLGPEDFFRELALPRLVPGAKFEKFDRKGFEALLKARENLIQKTAGRPHPAALPQLEKLGAEIQSKINKLLAGKVAAKGKVLERLRDDVLKHFGSSESFAALGRTGQEIIESKQLQLEKLAGSFFKKAAASLPKHGDDIVETTRIIDTIDDSLEKAKKLLVTEREPVINLLNRIKSDFIQAVPDPVDATKTIIKKELPYNTLIERRSGVGAAIRNLEQLVGVPGEAQTVISGKKISRLIKPVQEALDDSLSAFARKTGVSVDAMVKAGLSAAKQKFDFVKNPAIKQLMRSKPEQFLDVLLKPSQFDTIKLLKKHLSPAQMKILKRVATGRLLGMGADGPLTASQLQKNIRDSGENTLRELLGPADFDQLRDLRWKLLRQERSIARSQINGPSAARALGLTDIDMTTNKFFRKLIKNQKPQNILDLVYQPGNPKNVKKVYNALRAARQHQTIQDLKASLIERAIALDPKNGYISLKETNKNLKKLGDILEVAFSPDELKGLKEIEDVVELIERRKPGGSSISVFREVFEPVAGPMAWLYLRADGRNYLKRLLRSLVSETTREEKNRILTKLTKIGWDAFNRSRLRDEKKGIRNAEEETF